MIDPTAPASQYVRDPNRDQRTRRKGAPQKNVSRVSKYPVKVKMVKRRPVFFKIQIPLIIHRDQNDLRGLPP